jgi:hypothetical protein
MLLWLAALNGLVNKEIEEQPEDTMQELLA